MATTRKELRRRISDALEDLEIGTTTALGTTTTLVDTTRPEANDYWNKRSLIVTSGVEIGDIARVTDWVLSTGILTFTPASSGSIASGVEYELHWKQLVETYHRLIDEAIDRAHDRLFERKLDSTVTSTGVYEYTLPAAVAAGYLYDVEWLNTGSPTHYSTIDKLFWDVIDNAGTKILQFHPYRTPPSGQTIRLHYVAPVTKPTAETSNVPDIAVPFIVEYCLFRSHERLAGRSDIDAEEHLRRSILHREQADILLADLSPVRVAGKLIKGPEILEHGGRGSTRSPVNW